MARMKRATDEEGPRMKKGLVMVNPKSVLSVISVVNRLLDLVDVATKLRWVVCLFLQIGFERFRLYKPNEDWGMNHGWHRWHG